ncbi:hypothetical protein PVT67_09455 [Gallaecimonas kandeliae]|uniref:hypothetical protein n=1 Tax=Gallaecimonas kandeliae TaxID=3029055 RepID=UPI002647CE37|nr:hypothetical protein [Gallaecimonas kandeliae]WKE63926.1 hypothetical protein PVT67_09455 [Gallaecimonas kandeliae]
MLAALLLLSQTTVPLHPFQQEASRLCELAVHARLGMVPTDYINVQQKDQLVVASGQALRQEKPLTFICEFKLDDHQRLKLVKFELLDLKQDH